MMSQKKQEAGNFKVLLNAVPMPGHYLPLVHIANVLAKQHNFELTFSTSSYEIDNLKLDKKIKKLELHDDNKEKKERGIYKEIPVNDYDQQWEPELRSFVKKQKPALLVGDFFSLALMKIGQELKIPTVLHVSTSSNVMCIMDMPLLSKNISLFGFTLLTNKSYFYPKALQPMIRLGKYLDTSLVLVSSFFGLDPAKTLPPNIKMIGSTYSCEKKKRQELENVLRDWLKKVESKKKDIIYVCFGSIIKLSPSFIKFLFDGLKKIGNPVIWSLKQGSLPEENSNFFVSRWLPQEEILEAEQIKLVITHCGWSSVLQCINSQKPMLCLPFFGDQPENGKLVMKRQIGLVLRQKVERVSMPHVIQEPNFTHEQLEAKINQLLTQEKFKTNLKHLKMLMSETGGVEEAVKHIRNAAEHGIDHLIDKDVIKIRHRSIRSVIILMMLFALYFMFFGRMSSRSDKM